MNPSRSLDTLLCIFLIAFVAMFNATVIDIRKCKKHLLSPPSGERFYRQSHPAEKVPSGIPFARREIDIKKITEENHEIVTDNTAEGLKIVFEKNILFKSGKEDITPKGIAVLDKIIENITDFSGNIRIEGHTDNEPVTSACKFTSNYELSMARALSVASYFASKGKFHSDHLSAIGYGELRPRFPNDSPAHRAGNRRVEILLIEEKK
ncbi:MAG: flagellar motor protein MotB [Desulfococcaceae bacterium]|jgi:flagellar motor protein MotB|nr:flagellar motor protein MotB [Desulfococcaceae bacterium]